MPLWSEGLQLRKMTTHRSFLFRETLYKMFICTTERKRKEDTNSNNWLVNIWRYGYKQIARCIKSVWKGHQSPQAFYTVFHQWGIRLAQLTHSKVRCQGECPRLVHHLYCAKSYDTLIIKVIVWLIDWRWCSMPLRLTGFLGCLKKWCSILATLPCKDMKHIMTYQTKLNGLI